MAVRSLIRACITDDRGREVEVLALDRITAASTTPEDRRVRTDLARWLRRVGQHRRKTGWRSFAENTVIGILAIGLMLVLPNIMPFGFAWMAIMVLWIAFLIAISRIQRNARLRPHLAASLVAEGICGSCGYQLAGLTEDQDRHVVCPECGAAWRAARIASRGGRPAPLLPWERPRTFLGGDPSRRTGIDANGRIVPLMDSHLKALSNQARAQLGETEVVRISRAVRGPTATARILVGAATAALGVACALWFMRQQNDYRHPIILFLAVLIVVIGLALWLVIIGSEMFVSNRVKGRVMAAHGLCPSCAAPLAGASHDDLNHIVCQACGSAWPEAR